jgi:acyl-CoA synthetase (AMP-forming)/AMP-acid ligase II
VKIRGQRVELGEIEHQVKENLPDIERALPFVSQATELHGRHQLVVFIVFQGQGPSASTTVQAIDSERLGKLKRLKKALANALPPYMVPSLHIPLTGMPLTMNGKNDHRKLLEIIGRFSDDEIRALALSGDSTRGPRSDQIQTATRTAVMVEHQRAEKSSMFADCTQSDVDRIMEWNDSTPTEVRDTIHACFARQVAIRPTAPAICSSSIANQMTYEDVHRSATRLALYFVQKGIRKGEIVPLCFDKSAIAIISMFAILISGAACAFLSPGYPASRSKAIIDACKAEHLIGDPHHLSQFQEEVLSAIAVDNDMINSLPAVSDTKLPTVSHTDLAFVAFTSGSTGVPKGIMIEHRNYTTAGAGASHRFGIGYGTRILQFSAYTFGKYQTT